MSDRNNTDMAPDGHSADSSAGPVHLIAGMTITSGATSGHAAPHHQSSSHERAFITASPLPSGILFKGKKMKKRVSFRDRQLVDIREIPPRSSSADEYSDNEEDEDDVDGGLESDEATSSESEEEAEAPPPRQPAPPVVVNGNEKPVSLSVSSLSVSSLSVSKTPSSSTPVSPLSVTKAPSTAPVSTLNVRPERAPIPWTPMSSFTAGATKGSYNGTVSPATKVVSLVSRITGVSSSPGVMSVSSAAGVTGVTSSASQTHIRPRSATVASPSPSSSSTSSSSSPARKPTSPVPPKKPPTVVRVEKKVKKITPTLDNVMTSQTVRSVQKYGIVSEALHKGSSSSAKTGRKKRALQRRQEGSEKRKATSSRRNSSKDSKQSSSNNSKAHGDSPALGANKPTVHAKRNISSAGGARPRPKSVVNGFGHVRDSLSLPPLGSDDNVLLNPSSGKLLQHRPVAKTTVYTMDGFIFPGDPTHDLVAAAGLKASAAEDTKLKSHGVTPVATQISGYPGGRDQVPGQPTAAAVRDRVSSAPPGSTASSRRKRFYAWQMANGNLQNSLHEPPSITPMWETMTPVPAPTAPKPAYIAADR